MGVERLPNLRRRAPTPSLPGKYVDPFGIGQAFREVHHAWGQPPAFLWQRMEHLRGDYLRLWVQGWQRLCGIEVSDAVPAVPFDERFQEAIWTEHPWFDLLKEYYLAHTRWLEDTIEETPDLPWKARRKALFWARQALNLLSPSNFFWTNPHALFRCFVTGGLSAIDGFNNFVADAQKRDIRMVEDGSFTVGKNLASTPGEVVFRNALLELIQYEPLTKRVHEIPILIVAPWINKYYILDLNPDKSLVRYLLSRGFTVFITSWKNPSSEMRDTTLDDYMLHGVLEAVQVARAIAGTSQIHAVGYCIGGTLLTTLLAWLKRGGDWLKRDGEIPIGHATLLTALADFSHPGDIDVFIDEVSLGHLETAMQGQGYFSGNAMGWAFRLLRSNSLVWHYVVRGYLYGERPPPFDVLYWNTDTTRLPAAMHAFYLREFYLNNKLCQPDGLTLAGRLIDLRLIDQPLYVVGTEQDHIAPWKETFKLCALVQGPVRYVLATSGHILGVISPPVTPAKRRYWVGETAGQADPETWRSGLPDKQVGSWWEDWVSWLGKRCGPLGPPPSMGNEPYSPLAPAPGTYVFDKLV